MFLGLCQLALAAQQNTMVGLGGHVVGIDLESQAEFLDRLRKLLLLR